MKLVVIDYDMVKQDLTLPNPVNFNTSFHSAQEAPDLQRPSEGPVSFARWLPLILRSRGLSPSVVQTVRLSRSQARLLLNTAEGSLQSQTLNRMYADDIADEIIPLLDRELTFPPEGLFLRLAACSPKDGVHLVSGRMSMHTVDEIVLRTVTSTRARNALLHSLEDGEQESFDLFFMPFDVRMRSDREYRVFCPPGGHRITGISQYQWHKPWAYAHENEARQTEVVSRVSAEAERIRGLILDDLDESEMDRLLVEQGFSFDLLFDEERNACELVELNGFGARSSCGSCLFQWVRDREQLYRGEDMEFRVTK
ncbi:hypothetical protein DL546_000159 [Coniochaeta pulveracea]|uniref:Cell division cycle protein 123 n=1 Tax=Coniochaeta pulveracea TaxID=177199 RepID=A0A420Y436_9PEZI|nr:hypothetical protein DL546_000159 [Coniochaeta pulveracea]